MTYRHERAQRTAKIHRKVRDFLREAHTLIMHERICKQCEIGADSVRTYLYSGKLLERSQVWIRLLEERRKDISRVDGIDAYVVCSMRVGCERQCQSGRSTRFCE